MIIGATEEHIFAQEVARSLGLRTFVTDINPNAPGFKTADHFALASTYDYRGTLSAARNYEKNNGKISGVMAVATDVPFTVAYVADGLGLAGLPLDTARKLSEKLPMKEALHNAGLSILPLFEEIKSYEDAGVFAQKTGFPFIIKPIDSRGARGVQLVRERMDLREVFEITKKESPSGRVMAEEYLDGPQLSVEGAIVEGEAFLPAIFDRNYEYLKRFSPFIIENGGEMPSKYAKDFKSEAESVMAKAAKALGIRNGIVKGDFVIHEGKVKVIEIAGRLSGGFFGTVATPYSTGVNLIANVMRQAIGESVSKEDWMPTVEQGACIRFAFPPAGIVEDICGIDEIKKDKSCLYCGVFIKKEDAIGQMRSHPNRPALVVASGKDRLDSMRNAGRLMKKLIIKVR